MAIIVFQHWDAGLPGRLGLTLRDHGFKLDVRRPDIDGERAVPRDLDNVHGLVILGGPQNVTDIDKHPWMSREAELIRQADARQLPVIGICLGAQLIAHALGGTVAPRPKPAVGFENMSIIVTGQTDTLLSGLSWNSPQLFSCGQEITALPPGATLLASTKSTKNVLFRTGLRTFGSIAHFECDREMTTDLIRRSQEDAKAAGLRVEDLLASIDKNFEMYARLSDRLCVNLATYLFPLQRRIAI